MADLQLCERVVKSKTIKSCPKYHNRNAFIIVQSKKCDRYKQWHENSMEKAYNAVLQEDMSIRRAAEQFGVPKST